MSLTAFEGAEVLRAKGMNLLASVGQAAEEGPRLVVLEYKAADDERLSEGGVAGENARGRIALVGKGVTFDTGGLNLKPTGAIEGMHMDMCGAAAVLSAFKYVLRTVTHCIALHYITLHYIALHCIASQPLTPTNVSQQLIVHPSIVR